MASTALNLYASTQHGNSMPSSMASTALNLCASAQHGNIMPTSMTSTALNLFTNTQHGTLCMQETCEQSNFPQLKCEGWALSIFF